MSDVILLIVFIALMPLWIISSWAFWSIFWEYKGLVELILSIITTMLLIVSFKFIITCVVKVI